MGHKVHPIGFRIGVIRDWQAKWYADKHYADFVQEDIKLRQAIHAGYPEAGVSQVEIHRQANEVLITIQTSRPGVVIGRGGQRVDEMRLHLEKTIGKRVRLNIIEIHQPELDATLVAKTVAEQIGRRIAYRRAMKQAISRTIQAGARGVRISCAGRLGGAEIARRQTMHEGRVPLHTLRADIDYGFVEARTTLGRIGVKVWVYRGDILPEPKIEKAAEIPEELAAGGGEEAAPLAITEEVAAPVTAAEQVEAPAQPVAAESVEAAPAVEAEEKPAKPKARKAKAAPAVEAEEKPAKPKARKAKAAPAVEAEEKPAEPVAGVEPPAGEKEESDVTTETGEAPQES